MKLETRVEGGGGAEEFLGTPAPWLRRRLRRLVIAAAGLHSVRGVVRICGAAIVWMTGSVFAAEESPHHLVWRDGSSLEGRITIATATEMTIESPLFAAPLEVDSSVIGEVNFARTAPPVPEPFLFSLKDGTAVAGNITAITEEEVLAHNATLGDLVIPTIELLSIQRMSDADLAPPPDPTAADVAALDSNDLPPGPKARGPALAGTMHATKLPERCDIVLKMRAAPKPTFRLVVNGAGNRKVTIEAKNGDLILQGRLFVLIKNIAAVDDVVNLHLYWNQRSGLCALCTSGGECIAETSKGPVDELMAGGEQGVRIERSEPTFAIAFLGVNSWDGIVPNQHEVPGPGVMLTDDTGIKGRVLASDGITISVHDANGRVIPVPLEKVRRVRFGPARVTPSRPAAVALWFADGTTFDGSLTSIRDGVVSFKTRLSPEPVSFQITALRQMIFREPDAVQSVASADQSGRSNSSEHASQSAAAVDAVRWALEREPAATRETQKPDKRSRLQIHDRVIFGELAEGRDEVHWKPTGAKRAVPLSGGLEFAIFRPLVNGTPDGVIFHLADGEVISGKLTGITGTEIGGEWAFGSHFKLPADRVRAIQFASDRVDITGFDNEGWSPNADEGSAVSLKKEEAALSGNATLEHPDAMRAGEIRFNWQPTGSYGQLEMSLFKGNADSKAPGVGVRLSFSQGNRLRVLLAEEKTNALTELQSTIIDTRMPVAVRVMVETSTVSLWINESRQLVIPAPEERRAGTALGLGVKQSGMVVINGVINGRVLLRRDANGSPPIRIWNFIAKTTADSLRPAGGVYGAARHEALLIPRFRKDSPPKHVIVATNHDVLRGEVLAVTAEHLLFRTGLETVRVPLARIAAIVTPLPVKKDDDAAELKDDTKEDPGNSSDLVTHVSLATGGRVGLKLEAIRDGAITGTHPLIGACKIPLELVSGIERRRAAAPTTSHALDAWRWEYAPEPVLPETGGESSLALGKEAEAFKLPLLGGGEFDSQEEKGKIIVLDFWASWCGPCVKSLPGLIEAMSAFPPDKVRFIGVNQGEGGETVKRFLEARKLKLTVAMDGSQSVARQYGVDGIPHTVIIGPDGKIGWVKTGYSPEGAKEAAAAVTRMLTK